jgi:carboxypeptidase Q
MKYLITLTCALGFLIVHAQTDSLFIRKVYDEALEKGQSYENLRYLCKNIGARLSGSAEAEMAVQWGKNLMESYGFDRVYLQEIDVPHWERGTAEAAWIVDEAGNFQKIKVLALGGSEGTKGLLEADLITVTTLEDFEAMDAAAVAGKAVYIGQPFDQKLLNTFKAYSICGAMRWNGPNVASAKGAVALVIRSLGSEIDDHPHTGSFRYADDLPRIPAAAISTADSEVVEQWAKERGQLKIRLEMDCRWYGTATSYNVIGEMKGTESDGIITFGGHLDSWDVGEGAHDDGAGVVHSIEALRILKELGYKPRYTLRCVLFMNEENGNFGGKGYAEYAKNNDEWHVAALESDRGGFLPLGFDIDGSEEQIAFVQQLAHPLKKDFQLYAFDQGYSGVDIRPLKTYYPDMVQLGIAMNSQEYFKYHHTEADVFEAVDRRELALGCAAMASMIYLLDKNLVIANLED